MTSQDPEKVVRELFRRLSASEFDEMAELLAEDVEFDLAYAPDMLPMPTRGKTGVRELVVNVIGAMFDPFAIEVTAVYPGADDGVLVAEYVSDGTVVHNGKRYQNRYVGIFRVDGAGKIAFWREYHNTEEATRALS